MILSGSSYRANAASRSILPKWVNRHKTHLPFSNVQISFGGSSYAKIHRISERPKESDWTPTTTGESGWQCTTDTRSRPTGKGPDASDLHHPDGRIELPSATKIGRSGRARGQVTGRDTQVGPAAIRPSGTSSLKAEVVLDIPCFRRANDVHEPFRFNRFFLWTVAAGFRSRLNNPRVARLFGRVGVVEGCRAHGLDRLCGGRLNALRGCTSGGDQDRSEQYV